jgi:hypothetical protein
VAGKCPREHILQEARIPGSIGSQILGIQVTITIIIIIIIIIMLINPEEDIWTEEG